MSLAYADFSHRAKLRVTGHDVVRYLNGQLTVNIPALALGEVIPACLLDAKGRLQAELMVRRTDETEFWLDAPGELVEHLAQRLEQYVIADDVLIENHSDHWKILYFEGADLTDPSLQRLSLLRSRRMASDIGYETWVPADQQLSLAAPPVDERALEFLRLSRAIPKWGTELNHNSLPGESSLVDRAVDFTKGCYIGQEVVSRMKSVGHPSRRLLLFDLPPAGEGSTQPPALGDRIVGSDGTPCGTITSMAADTAGSHLALGYVKWAYLSDELKLQTAHGALHQLSKRT